MKETVRRGKTLSEEDSFGDLFKHRKSKRGESFRDFESRKTQPSRQTTRPKKIVVNSLSTIDGDDSFGSEFEDIDWDECTSRSETIGSSDAAAKNMLVESSAITAKSKQTTHVPSLATPITCHSNSGGREKQRKSKTGRRSSTGGVSETQRRSLEHASRTDLKMKVPGRRRASLAGVADCGYRADSIQLPGTLCAIDPSHPIRGKRRASLSVIADPRGKIATKQNKTETPSTSNEDDLELFQVIHGDSQTTFDGWNSSDLWDAHRGSVSHRASLQ